DVLISLGIGKIVVIFLGRIANFPPEWRTPLWLIVSAILIWLSVKFVRWSSSKQQQPGTQTLATTEIGRLTAHRVQELYRSLDQRLSSEMENALRLQAEQFAGVERESFLIRIT